MTGSAYFPLTDSVAKMRRRLAGMSDAEKRAQLNVLLRVIDALCKTVMPKSIPQPNVEFFVKSFRRWTEASREAGWSTASLSAAAGPAYVTVRELQGRVTLYAKDNSRPKHPGYEIDGVQFYIADDSEQVSELDFNLVVSYVAVQILAGPEPYAFEIMIPCNVQHGSFLCSHSLVKCSVLKLKPHSWIEEVVADLALDGIEIDMFQRDLEADRNKGEES